MKLVPILLTFSLTSLFCFSLSAQVLDKPDLRRDLQPVVQYIYNLDHGSASRELKALESAWPTDPAIPLLWALNEFWKAELSNKDMATHPMILQWLADARKKNEQFEDDPSAQQSYHFVQFMAWALEARLRYFEEADWSSVNAARKVLSHLEPVIDMASGSPELSLIAGLYHYYSVSYPRDKSYLRPFMAFFPDGNIQLGLQELSLAANQPNIGQAQALYYLTDIYQFELRDPELAMESSGKLHELFPQNTWFHADYIRSLILARKFTQANQECDGLIRQFEAIPGHSTRTVNSRETRFTSQMMARIYHYKGKMAYHGSGTVAEAKNWFDKSQKMIRFSEMDRSEYAAFNFFYLGLCEDELGNRQAALAHYENAIDHPDNNAIEEAAENCEDVPCRNYQINQ